MREIWEQLINLLGDAIHIVDPSPLPVASPSERAVHRRQRLRSMAALFLLAAIPLAVMAWYFR